MKPLSSGTTLHHVGFVVESIESSMDSFMESICAAGRTEIVEDPIQRVKVAFLLPEALGQPQVELVEPVGEKSPVYRFLRERGGGLHHICYEVNDVAAYLKLSQQMGLTIVRRPRPAAAFGGREIAWVLSKQRLLIEYLAKVQEASIEAKRMSAGGAHA